MAYEKQTFENLSTTLTAEHLEHIEDGIYRNSTEKLDASELPKAVNDALAQAKASGEFDGADGKSAYRYALETGYTGTEEDFAKFLANADSELTELSEQVADLQYVNTDTPEGYSHENLSEFTKTVTVFANETYECAPYIFLGKDYFPRTDYINATSLPFKGMNYVSDGYNTTITGKAEAGTGFYVADDELNTYWEIPSGVNVGDTLKLYVFGKMSEYASPYVKVELFDENKSRITFIQARVGVGSTVNTSGTATITDACKYMRVQFSFNNGDTHDNTIFPVLVKGNTSVINNGTFTDGSFLVETDNATTAIVTAPYKSSVNYLALLKDYIDDKSSNVDFDLSMVEDIISAVTPEMFGAFGDNAHDDTQALQDCIDYAIEHNRKMLAAGTYSTSAPLVINCNRRSFEFNQIQYTGTDAAIIVNGSYNIIKVTTIYATNGKGFRLISDNQTSCYNNLHLGYLYTKNNGVEYLTTNYSIVGNTLEYGYIEVSNTANCIHQEAREITDTVNMGNYNFVGGRLLGGLWGVYGAKGTDTYITPQFEGVANCIYHNGIGLCRIVSPRYAEVAYFSVDYNQSGRPALENKGVVYASAHTKEIYTNEDASKIIYPEISPSGGRLMPLNIDVSRMPISFVGGSGQTVSLSKVYPSYQVVRVKLETKWTEPIADEFLLFGRHILIRNPSVYRVKQVSSADHGYLGDYRETGVEDEFIIYHKFTIGESGCDYTLPPSYDSIAFSKFIVEQPEGTSCTFRDWRGTVIFNGAEYGAGTYEVHAHNKNEGVNDDYNNINQAWDIRRISLGDLVATT